MDEIQENLGPQGTSRRTVIKGAAWAAPVVAVAAAVPLASASPVEPLPTRFYYTVGTDAVSLNGVYHNLSVTGGNLTLEGAPGDNYGKGSVAVDVPVGYTWVPGDLSGWDGPVVTSLANGKIRYTYTSIDSLQILAGENHRSLWFAGGVMQGTGADVDNQARLQVKTATTSASTTYWPDED